MQSTFGKNIRVSIWGGSHEPAIGVDIEGIPVGTRIDMNRLRAFLKRRAPGNSPFATKRKEPDLPIPVRGVAVWGGGTPPVQAGDEGQVGSDQSAAILSGDSTGHHAQGSTVSSDSISSADNTSSFAQVAENPGNSAQASAASGTHNPSALTPGNSLANSEISCSSASGTGNTDGLAQVDLNSGDHTSDSLTQVNDTPGCSDPGAHNFGGLASGNSPASTEISRPSASSNSNPDALAEADEVVVTDSLISFEIRNTDTRSGDYKGLRAVPRPGHADYTARLRYGDSLNMAGGGPFSARMTAPLCIAGGIALQMLEQKHIEIGAHLFAVAGVEDTPLDPVKVTAAELESLQKMEFPVLSEDAGEKMAQAILQAKDDLDSVGGVVEVCATGLPGGVGGAMYDGLESYLAPIFFGIPAVKGVEFGAGFHAAELRGSENNDPFYYDNNGQVKTRTNHHGGILGGITTGMPLLARLAFKPTPSISKEQDSVDLEAHKNEKLVVKGRHDPCVAVRAVPITEAALALGILDCIMEVTK